MSGGGRRDFPITCANCEKQNTVPFEPKGDGRYYAAIVSKPKDPLVKREIAEVVMGVKSLHLLASAFWWCLFEKLEPISSRTLTDFARAAVVA